MIVLLYKVVCTYLEGLAEPPPLQPVPSGACAAALLRLRPVRRGPVPPET